MFAVFLLGAAFGLSSMSAIETILYIRRHGLKDYRLITGMIVDVCVIALSLDLLNYV